MSGFVKSTQVSVSSPLLATDNEWIGQNNMSGTFLNKGVVVPDISTVNTTISSSLANISTGSFTCTQSYDTLQPLTFSSTLTISYTTGMVSYMPTSGVISTLNINDIPSTTFRAYVFTFVFPLGTANSPWYITAANVTINGTSTPMKGTIALPAAYTVILQSITVIRTGASTFLALNSVQGY